ncbi:MAG: NusG domain II-containing protein [Clostridia bacterium]|nr:NusG domain II-containing protein [Clostridia bacterium]
MGKKKMLHDLILVGAVLAAALAVYVLVNVLGRDGQTVVVTVDGTVIAEKPITVNDAVEIKDADGYNRVVIDNREVYMESADCPDKVCVKTGRISRAGETIVCLPHKVVVKIKGGEDADAVVQ